MDVKKLKDDEFEIDADTCTISIKISSKDDNGVVKKDDVELPGRMSSV